MLFALALTLKDIERCQHEEQPQESKAAGAFHVPRQRQPEVGAEGAGAATHLKFQKSGSRCHSVLAWLAYAREPGAT